MPKVVGVKFEGTAKIYSFSAGDFEYKEGDKVIVDSSRGAEIGIVKQLPYDIKDNEVIGELKPVIRIATKEDLERQLANEESAKKTLLIVEEKANARKLKMKIINVQYTIDGGKLIVYFSAEGRVDFRELVRDLAGAFRLRIEMCQIGEREECRMIGGLGVCGRKLCCASGCDFTKVNIKMAKNQNLSLNPQKISGTCGRLMCCLAYENDYYVEANKMLPRMNADVLVDGKKGQVVGLNQLKMRVKVKFETQGGYEFVECEAGDVTVVPKCPCQNQGEKKNSKKLSENKQKK